MGACTKKALLLVSTSLAPFLHIFAHLEWIYSANRVEEQGAASYLFSLSCPLEFLLRAASCNFTCVPFRPVFAEIINLRFENKSEVLRMLINSVLA